MNKVYFVSDIVKIPVMGNESHLIYLREVNESDVLFMRRADNQTKQMMLTNKMSRNMGLSEVYSSVHILDSLYELESGDFGGLYLTQEIDLDFPKVGFTYNHLPESWEKIDDPSKIQIGQTSIEDLIRNHWWRSVKGYEK